MLRQKVSWVDAGLRSGRVAVMPRPYGDDWLEQDLAGLRAQGADILVSLLEPDEALSIGLGREAELCHKAGLTFVSYPVRDRSVPDSMGETRRLAASLENALRKGLSIVFHCWAGIGRSSLMCACVLSLAGLDPADAFHRIGLARGLEVPDTDEQRMWVVAFAQRADERG
jgi:protein-tyrosine phosphatase